MNQSLAYSVLAPGPVNLHPEVRKILAEPMIHHRTPEFEQILRRTLTNLKQIFQTEQDCYALTATGSGGMECALVNTLKAGDEVLAIDSGKFGERWADMAQVFGGKVHTLKVKWGEAVNPDVVQSELQKNPRIKIVMCQACETSTAVVHPIQALAQIVSEKADCLFLVDAITALGALNIPMDKWGIDVLIGGSQKAFMLPTGLSLISFSKKAWAKIENNPTPRYYFDIRKEKAANQKGETFFSSNIILIKALDFVIELWIKEGLSLHYTQIENRSLATKESAKALGLKLFGLANSPTLTAVQIPENLDGQKIRDLLESEFRFTVMGGQDQLKGKILRIGHMGMISRKEMIELFLSLRDLLERLNPSSSWPTRLDFFKKLEQIWSLDVEST